MNDMDIIPTNQEEWISLFNRTSELIGYPDARDDFHPRRDLEACLKACRHLLAEYDLVRWRRPTIPSITAHSLTGPVKIKFAYEKKELSDNSVEQILTSVEQEISTADILTKLLSCIKVIGIA